MDKLKSCENCKNNIYIPKTGTKLFGTEPCRECWKFCNWMKKPDDSNNYYWSQLPERKKVRKIQIEFEIPEEYEEDYSDVDTELVVEDFVGRFVPELAFKVINDSHQLK